MPSLTTAMKYNSNSATCEDVTGYMYFSDVDADNAIIAEQPLEQ